MAKFDFSRAPSVWQWREEQRATKATKRPPPAVTPPAVTTPAVTTPVTPPVEPPAAPAAQPAPPPTWQQVVETPEFQGADPAGREAIREDFWNRVVLPRLQTDEIESTRAVFDERTGPDRTAGRVVSDFGASLGVGVGNVISTIGNIGGLATGRMDNVVTQAGEQLAERGREAISPQLAQQQRDQQARVDAAEGVAAKAWEAIKGTVVNPALLATFAAEQLPMLVPPAAVARTTGLIMRAARHIPGVAGKIAGKAATPTAVGAAVATGAGMHGADVGGQTYGDVEKALVDGGMPQEQARAQALSLARQAAGAAATIEGVTAAIPGAREIDKLLAGARRASAAGGKAAAKAGLKGGALGLGGESLQEGVAEGTGQLISNIAVQQVDPTRDITEGVGQATGLGILGGAIFGGPAGTINALRERSQKLKEQAAQLRGDPVPARDVLGEEAPRTERGDAGGRERVDGVEVLPALPPPGGPSSPPRLTHTPRKPDIVADHRGQALVLSPEQQMELDAARREAEEETRAAAAERATLGITPDQEAAARVRATTEERVADREAARQAADADAAAAEGMGAGVDMAPVTGRNQGAGGQQEFTDFEPGGRRGRGVSRSVKPESRELPSVEVEAYHWSKAERPVISTAYYGTGLRGSAREEILADPELRRRASFYFDKGTGVRPEAGVGGIAHRVRLTNIYDSNADPLKLRGADPRAFERRLMRLGYDGYLDRLEGTQPGQVVVLGDKNIKAEVLGPRSKIEPQQQQQQQQQQPPQWQVLADNLSEAAARQAMTARETSPRWKGWKFRVEQRGRNFALEGRKAQVAQARQELPTRMREHTQRIERVVEQFKAQNKGARKLNISVVDSHLDENVPAGWMQSRTEGVYFGPTGDVILNAAALPHGERAWEVLSHEIVGHHGVESLFAMMAKKAGADLQASWDALMEDVRRLMPNEVADRIRHRYNEQQAPREVLAKMAERGDNNHGLLDRAIAILRRAARALGLRLSTNRNDLRELVRLAAKHVREGENVPGIAIDDTPARSPAAETFFSSLERGVREVPAKGMPAGDWIQRLSTMRGVKPAELEWTGVLEWLRLQPGKVSKESLIGYLDEHGVKIEERVRRQPHTKDGALDMTEQFDGVPIYSDYRRPKGDNYRELLIIAPPRGERRGREGKVYRSPHWAHEENVVAHIRVDDHEVDGKRVLFVHEIQSDWAQTGREKGFVEGEGFARPFKATQRGQAWEVLDANGEFIGNVFTANATAEQAAAEIERRLVEDPRSTAKREGVPRAPFVEKTEAWVGLAVKRVLRMAVDGGYDRVAFVNGTQATGLYDLEKHVSKIIATAAAENAVDLNVFDKEGQSAIRRTYRFDELPDVVGKETAEKILRGLGAHREALPGIEPARKKEKVTLSGLDLKIGGEGMKTFYDHIVPNIVADVAKKVGGRLSTIEVSQGETQYAVDVADIRERTLQGQPLFSKRPDDLFEQTLKPSKTAMAMNWIIENAIEARGILGLPSRHVSRWISKRAFGEAVNAWRKGKVARDDYSKSAVMKLGTALAQEVEWYHGYAKDSGVDWFEAKYQRAIDELAKVEPSLKTKEGRGLFSLMLAITSDGAEVQDNMNLTMEIYQAHRSGKGLSSVAVEGKYEPSIHANLKIVEKMIDEYGVQGTLDLLLEPVLVADAKAELAAAGLKNATSDYPNDHTLPRAAIFIGPKLGAFYANLMGEPGYLTMDRWWNRTINRYRGHMTPYPTESSLAKFREMIGKPRITEERLLDIAEEIDRERQKKHKAAAKMGRKHEGTDIEKLATTINKNAKLELLDAPQGPEDRAFMIAVAQEAQRQLKGRNIEASIANIQATIWYYEKELFESIGVKGRGRISYEEAAKKWVRERERSTARDGRKDVAREKDRNLDLFGVSASLQAEGRPATLEDFDGEGIKEILNRSDWVIMTAENPGAKPATSIENEANNARLEAELKKRGLKYKKVTGRYGQDENSFVIVGVKPKVAAELGRMFDQESVLTGRGLVYSDGQFNPAVGVEVFDTPPGDFFSKIGNTYFRVNIDFDAKIAPPVKSNEFKKWFGKSKVVDENGDPLVVYHGTVRDFDQFDPDRVQRGLNVGEGFYFTSSPEDLSFNYANPDGPDISNRVEEMADQIVGEFETRGRTITHERARRLAERRMVKNRGVSMPVYLQMENPAVLGGRDETVFDYKYDEDSESGSLLDFLHAMRNVLEGLNADTDTIIGEFTSLLPLEDGKIKLSDIEDALKRTESLYDIEDEGGLVYTGDVFGRVIQAAGFDGIIDHTVSEKFGKDRKIGTPMIGVTRNTTHYIVFRPTQVKSAIGNIGTYDPQDPKITRSLPVRHAPEDKHSGLIDLIFKTAFKATAVDRLVSWAYNRVIEVGGKVFPEKVKAGLISDFGLPEPYLDAKIEKNAEVNRFLRRSRNVLDHLAGLDREQSRIAYLWMTEKPDTALEKELLRKLPEEARAAVIQMKEMIDELGREAVKVGLLSQESYERNKMAYLHRTYQKHLEARGDDVGARMKRNAAIRAENFKGRGLRDDVSDDHLVQHVDEVKKGDKFIRLELRGPTGKLLRKIYVPEGRPIPPMFADWKQDGVWEARFWDKKKSVGLWRDLSKDERARLGEVEEVRYAFATTVISSIKDIENMRFLGWVKDTYGKSEADVPANKIVEASEAHLQAKTYARDEWVKVPETRIPGTKLLRYGPLAGTVIPAQMFNDIKNQMVYPESELGRYFDAILRAWKLSKTALSPTVHTNNVMANFILADIADVRARDVVKAMRTILAARKGDARAKDMIERYEDSGAEYGTFLDADLGHIEPTLKELEVKQNEDLALLSAVQIVNMATHGQLGAAARAVAAKKPVQVAAIPFKALIAAYRAEDSVFRLAKFMREVEAGASDSVAGKAARDAFLNYDINAPWIQFARRTFLPFIAFSYRAIPKMAESVGEKPWKAAKYLSIGSALTALTYLMLGADADEDRERRLLPDEMQGKLLGVFPRAMRMPWNDEHGSPVFKDLRRWVPAGDMLDLSHSQSALPVPTWLTISGPLGLVIEVSANKSMFTGRPIWKETDDTYQKFMGLGDHLFKFMVPNLPLPGPGTILPTERGQFQTWAWQGILDAGTGRTDPFGREQSLSTALLSSVGVKLRVYPEDVAVQRIILDYEKKRREIGTNANRLARELARGGISREEYEEKMARENRKLDDLNKALAERLK